MKTSRPSGSIGWIHPASTTSFSCTFCPTLNNTPPICRKKLKPRYPSIANALIAQWHRHLSSRGQSRIHPWAGRLISISYTSWIDLAKIKDTQVLFLIINYIINLIFSLYLKDSIIPSSLKPHRQNSKVCFRALSKILLMFSKYLDKIAIYTWNCIPINITMSSKYCQKKRKNENVTSKLSKLK